MSIAIYIKSESCDSYLYSYDTGTSEEKIKDDLETDLDMFRPIADYMVQVSSSESPSLENRLEFLMSDIFNQSWKRDDE
ncbi:hypothetical protein PP428_gp154 [Escherichia phage vB_EcoM_RZ]|uniref:Uncharacterized protein n=1 Tax=Escherichia phage vB_EcoM_RZ TaxID=2893954 RepID=A0AAE8YIF5_9CAUD|nr:hypothetical protein PP428_gp154 [Escherichia phage vB_EcoM_RZ]UGL59970.1 hypothetical protein [Escherichia phage vB_EcoM_RZ]